MIKIPIIKNMLREFGLCQNPRPMYVKGLGVNSVSV